MCFAVDGASGSSFITDVFGKVVAEANETDDGVFITSRVHLDEARTTRFGWGVFR